MGAGLSFFEKGNGMVKAWLLAGIFTSDRHDHNLFITKFTAAAGSFFTAYLFISEKGEMLPLATV